MGEHRAAAPAATAIGYGVRQAHREMAAIAHELIQLIPQEQQALQGYFCLVGVGLVGTSDSQVWRTFSDQFL